MSGVPIYRREWRGADGLPALTDIRASLLQDGGLYLERQDIGGTTGESWGDADAEFWMTLAPADLRRALIAVLRDGFSRPGPLTWAGLATLLAAEGIDTKQGSWT